MKAAKQILKAILLSVLVFWCFIGIAVADTSSSANYRVDETFFGTGGELNACSSQYCTQQSAGETAVGNSRSTSYQIQPGYNTKREPTLTFVVDGTANDLGTLSPTTTATATATFSVATYLSNGYTVINASDPPSYGSHTLNALTTPTAAAAGTEQFGINLVRNQTGCATPAPANFGADPAQSPDSTFAFGTSASGYNTCGLFKYAKGDIIAQSNQSTSTTTFTISYIYNISKVTPAGTYKFNHILVATATY